MKKYICIHRKTINYGHEVSGVKSFILCYILLAVYCMRTKTITALCDSLLIQSDTNTSGFMLFQKKKWNFK